MVIHTVSSGSFMVSSQKPEIMLAYLGSCVGVTLFDREAQVGGLIHLLLPEPPSKDRDWNPEVSALDGMPIFIDALCKNGARKERLQACIAGGALMDPVSQADLKLDLGGRTAETAEEILKKEKIHVVKVEVGGYFSCCIKLDLKSWETLIEPITTPSPKTTTENFERPTIQQLDEVIEGLLPIPQTALKIIRMIQDESCSFRELSKEILQDQVLSARLIRTCNTISINHGMKVDSVEKALLRVGEKNLILLALSFSVEKFLVHQNQGYSLCKGGIFHHSVWTAGISCKLAELTGKADPAVAYTAGLLHDIGKVVLDQYICSVFPLFYRQLQISGNDLVAVEKSLFGISHTQAGYLLANRWKMPDFVSETILRHHEPQKAQANGYLAYFVYVADLISFRFALGHDLDKIDTTLLPLSLDTIGLTIDDLPLLIAEAPFQAFDIAS
jgi:putative nucleotidyltransferase with HDIG domain